MAEDHKELELQRIVVDPTIPPEVANGFVWARVGEQFLFEVGFFDMLNFHDTLSKIRKGEESGPVQLFISKRYVIGRETLNQLKTTVDQMLASLEARDAAG